MWHQLISNYVIHFAKFASSIVPEYAESFSIFIFYSSIYFSGTTVASTSSPTPPTVRTYLCNYATTDAYVYPYRATDASIAS